MFGLNDDLLALPVQLPEIKCKHSEEDFRHLCTMILERVSPEKQLEWTPMCELVCQWLKDNHRKGLFLWGKCGRGKTFLTKYVIAYVLRIKGIVPTVINAIDLPQNISLIRNPSIHYYIIDDIGTEKPLNDFGVKSEVFAELMYRAEQDGKLVIITSNLDKNGILERYGERTYSRIKGLCATNAATAANGKDFRVG